MASPSAPSPRRVVAEVDCHPDGRPRGFRLSLGNERTLLEPGKPWVQADHFKWVTRGVIEAPQSFAAHPDGSVDLNGDTFRPEDPDAAALLTEQLNKRHLTSPAASPKPLHRPSTAAAPVSDRVQFKVRLDHLGHLLVEARRGTERTETGLRGLEHLAADGWMLHPTHLHIDPLQRYLELDGQRFDCTAVGAAALEETLNRRYAPALASHQDVAIEIRENPAASTGFDIHFWTVRAGTRFENKGHLSQDKLDILQDHDKCDLLEPGIILRLSPPYLYIRRRRPDGGEEHVPGLPDVKYRGIQSSELQRLLNHPAIRRAGSVTAPSEPPPQPPSPTPTQAAPEPPPADDAPRVPPPAPEAPPSSPPLPSPTGPLPPRLGEVSQSSARPAFTPPPKAPPPPVAPRPAEPTLDPAVVALFADRDPHHINEAVFRNLAGRLHFSVQDLLLSLPRIFEDRRFEILDFNGEEILSVLQLRSAHFYGFYLTHIGPERIDLVYACHGTHIEWGTDKCAFQSGPGAETLEMRGTGLLGLAQNADHHFVFVVEPRYLDWIKPHAAVCASAFAHFVGVEEWASRRAELPLIWPG